MMRRLAAAAMVLATGPTSSVGAATVAGVYNTGLGIGGAALAAGNGRTDANYTIVPNGAMGTSGPSARTFAEFNWFAPDTAAARAINATGTFGGALFTTTTYRTTFDLTGYDLATAVLTGRVRANDSARVALNGHDLGIEASTFSTSAFTATNVNFFTATVNHLDFIVRNTLGNTAVRVTDLRVAAEWLPSESVGTIPEPESWTLFIIGFGLVGAAIRRQRSPSDGLGPAGRVTGQ